MPCRLTDELSDSLHQIINKVVKIKMVISYDLDKTLTDNPELAQVATAMQAMGHRNIVLTGRKSDVGIRELLNNLGFPNETEIITKAGHDGSIIDFKSKKLQEIGADLYIDADEITLPDGHPTKVLTFQRRMKFGRVTR